MTTPNFFIFGMGYSARAAADTLRAQFGDNTTIAGTSRSAAGASAISGLGYEGLVFDGKTPSEAVLARLKTATHLIISIAPNEDGDPVLNAFGEVISQTTSLEWICYYSTVGVYGDAGGGWVDESTPPDPVNTRSQWRVAAETAWQDLCAERQLPLTILRLAGIYGPGRSAFDKLRKGTAKRIIKPGQVFNRIHCEDIANVTAASARQRLDGLYNLADDLPAPPQDVVRYAAELAGMTAPAEVAFEDAEMSPMARSFYSDNKRVSNAAIKAALGYAFAYPDYFAGLNAIWKDLKDE